MLGTSALVARGGTFVPRLPQPALAVTTTPHLADVSVIVPVPTATTTAITSLATGSTEYIEIVNSCGPDWSGGCLNARAHPSASSTSELLLRKGMVLKVATTTYQDEEGKSWYKVVFDEWLRYPDRLGSTLYVAADFVQPFSEVPEPTNASTTKHIIVDRSEQKLYAYDGDTLFMEAPVSTGLDLTPTPRGTFTVYQKTPTRYMQGPLPGISDQYYDLPGVPWDLYFTPEGGAIHGAYWHNHFGEEWSHGCVNLPLDLAHKLYDWAPVGTPVLVRD